VPPLNAALARAMDVLKASPGQALTRNRENFQWFGEHGHLLSVALLSSGHYFRYTRRLGAWHGHYLVVIL
jgi:hypothetical protein